EPAVKNSVIARKRRKHRKLLWREVVHNVMGVTDIPALFKIALYEPLHRWYLRGAARSEIQLQIDSREIVRRVGTELALVRRKRLDPYQLVRGVRVGLLTC